VCTYSAVTGVRDYPLCEEGGEGRVLQGGSRGLER